ncbi:antibiotic biosynthesis monooxygenase [Rhizobium sp. 3T7]|uniref:putative quinol monooxygenase n=1 Tax=Rhizobium sp. 3T7 TaxID=2874922 RepID=UPI001CCF8738|nr:antibiotic biosynthesis monooxygenase [Rhizobium sp. 3T7]MBZ9790377.1 antibiotic biosynthesis monooxygenase [Rhizobium sp. 3T7]
MTKQAIYVELKARSGKEEEVAAFLTSAQALVAQEPGTVAWFAVRYDQSTFAIFDAFDDEADRQAHLNGKVAAALMARAEELLAEAPQLRTPEVLVDKLPG